MLNVGLAASRRAAIEALIDKGSIRQLAAGVVLAGLLAWVGTVLVDDAAGLRSLCVDCHRHTAEGG